MKKLIKKMSVVSLFALSTFTFTSVVQPVPAHAIIGAAAWPLFPLMIVGAALEGSALVTGFAALGAQCKGFHRSAWDLTGLTIDQFFLGIIFLDHQGENASLSPVNAEQANQYRLTLAEMQAYNHAVVNGDLEAIFQQAAQELNRDSTHDQAKGVMQGLLSALPSDAHIAVNKISQYLVTRK
jgi:hypothetical protein